MEWSLTPREWSALTLSAGKCNLFAQDLYFRESWSQVVEVFGRDASATIQSLALVSIKPDAIVSRRVKGVLSFVYGRGFLPVAVARMRHTRRSIREMWRYNWNILTIDRIALNTLMYGATDTLVVALLDTRYDRALPAALRLGELKGPAGPGTAGKDTLRSKLGCRSLTFSFVHVADEPADIVRELGVMFDRDSMRTFLQEVRANMHVDRYHEVLQQLTNYEASQQFHDLDFEQAIGRLDARHDDSHEILRRLRRAADSTSKLSWDELLSMVDPQDPEVDSWDFISIASEVVSSRREGFTDLLPSSRSSDWIGRSQAAYYGQADA